MMKVLRIRNTFKDLKYDNHNLEVKVAEGFKDNRARNQTHGK